VIDRDAAIAKEVAEITGKGRLELAIAIFQRVNEFDLPPHGRNFMNKTISKIFNSF